MTLLKDLQSYQERRRFPDWQPKPTEDVRTDNSKPEDKVILRALEFLPLELQVADWDREAQLVPELEEVESILERNASDEDKHDEVLGYLATHYGKRGVEDSEAISLLKRWVALNCHPVVSMYALECGVFFSILPALTKFGDVYAATVAQWINDDERVHVETNLRLMKALGLKLTDKVVRLVYDTNIYIFSPMGTQYAESQGQRAVRRLTTGKDKQMTQESVPVTIAFFEQRNKQSIVY